LAFAVAFSDAPAPHIASAHGVPVPFNAWGGFTRSLASCQRAVGLNAATCGLHVWQMREACTVGELHGAPCDQSSVDSAVNAEQLSANDGVFTACTDQQAVTLVFLGRYEASNDVVTFCRDLERAATSAVFLPVGSNPASLSAESRQCVEATATATTKLLHRALQSRQRLLDRIALQSYPLPFKHALLTDSTADIAHDAASVGAAIADTCPADAFMRTYGRDPATFLALIATRADCLAGRAYAQDGVLCPPPQCGNGMIEPGEDCDDGNLVDGDGCSSSCTRE
jgi:cysteine-rich repeat protein